MKEKLHPAIVDDMPVLKPEDLIGIPTKRLLRLHPECMRLMLHIAGGQMNLHHEKIKSFYFFFNEIDFSSFGGFDTLYLIIAMLHHPAFN